MSGGELYPVRRTLIMSAVSGFVAMGATIVSAVPKAPVHARAIATTVTVRTRGVSRSAYMTSNLLVPFGRVDLQPVQLPGLGDAIEHVHARRWGVV